MGAEVTQELRKVTVLIIKRRWDMLVLIYRLRRKWLFLPTESMLSAVNLAFIHRLNQTFKKL